MFFSKVEAPPSYHLVDTPKKLSWLLEELGRSAEFAFDIETNHPTWKGKKKLPEDFVHRVAGISFAWGRTQALPWEAGTAAYVPVSRSDDGPYWGARQQNAEGSLKEILETDIPKVAHNGKFDVRQLAALMGIHTRNLTFDTMLAHALLDEERLVSSHALKSDFSVDGKVIKLGISDAYLSQGASYFKDDLQQALQFYDQHMKRYSKVPLKVLYPYACADADLTLALKFVFTPMLEEEGLTWVFNNLIMPLQHTLTLMELHGVPLDLKVARQVLNEQAKVLLDSERAVHQMCGAKFNVGSPKQLGQMLFETLGLPGKKNKHKEWVTDADALKGLEHPIREPLLNFRRAQQIHGLYAEAALDKVEEVTNGGRVGWVHPTFWMDSATGRLKCADPNLTTLPRPENGGLIVKSMWCAADDYRLIFKDFSQIELRVAAHLSGEPVWIDGFNAGHDMHAAMAAKIWHPNLSPEEVKRQHKADRSKAKTVNFGIIYGQSEFSLAERLGMTPDEAHTLINDDYFGAAPVLRQWIDDTHAFVKAYGYVNNLFGRRRHLPDAQLQVPPTVAAPKWESRPPCYKDGPYPLWLGIDPQELYQITTEQLRDHMRAVKSRQFEKCKACPHLHSCVINREARYVKGKVGRALRQSVNSPIQGTAVDMASLSLVWINQEIHRHELPAAPILHIHDELVVYAHTSCIDQVCAIMDDAMTVRLREMTQFRVPLLVDTEIVQRWSDKHIQEDAV